MDDLILEGCRPEPLASYLKGVGVFRLLANASDSSVRAFWQADRLVLRTTHTRKTLKEFFLEAYVPTPVVAPWNGGSGFHPKDNTSAFTPIAESENPRFRPLAETIQAARRALDDLGLDEKPGSDLKPVLLERCRGTFPDFALDWLDAAFVLTNEDPKYPPLLGTGGNDGRLDFTNNYLQRLVMLMSPQDGSPTPSSSMWLDAALFGEPTDGLGKDTMGQFEPAAVASNPWDFILMLEGAMIFAAAASNRLGTQNRGYAYPFTVRQTAAGYGSAAPTDESESRGEIWMPLWTRPATYAETSAMFHEGRAAVGKLKAKDGLDFARAASSLGVDRGIAQFNRFGFQVRNGLAYFATPLGRISVGEKREAALLTPLNPWLERFRRAARDKNVPAAVTAAAARLDDALFRMLEHQRDHDVRAAFVALGQVERALVRSRAWAEGKGVRPIPWLGANWLAPSDDGTPEFRLACALGALNMRWEGDKYSTTLRHRLEPITGGTNHAPSWRKEPKCPDVARVSGDLLRTMEDLFRRQVIEYSRKAPVVGAAEESHWVEHARVRATNGDVRDFVDGFVDESYLYELLWSCALIKWSGDVSPTVETQRPPDAAYALLKLCFAGQPVGGQCIPVTPQIFRLARAGDPRAIDAAYRRLRGSDQVAFAQPYPAEGDRLRRIALALLFPVSGLSMRELEARVLTGKTTQKNNQIDEVTR